MLAAADGPWKMRLRDYEGKLALAPQYLAQVSEVGEFPPEAAFVRDLRATLSPRDTHWG